MEIQIKRRQVHGRTLIYVCNEPALSAIDWLTGKKTINSKDIAALQQLGHVIYDCDAVISELIKNN